MAKSYDPENPVHRKRNAEYQRKWYRENREKRIRQVAERKQAIAAWFTDYKKDLCCTECGFSHPATLDFHHTDPADKEFSIADIARKGYSMDRILSEIEKCIVLCANCHRIFHYSERPEE